MPRMKNIEYPAAGLVVEILEKQHADYAGERAEQSKWGVALQFRKYGCESLSHLCLALQIRLSASCLEAGQFAALKISQLQLSCKYLL
jgi:hypothetical protein